MCYVSQGRSRPALLKRLSFKTSVGEASRADRRLQAIAARLSLPRVPGSLLRRRDELPGTRAPKNSRIANPHADGSAVLGLEGPFAHAGATRQPHAESPVARPWASPW